MTRTWLASFKRFKSLPEVGVTLQVHQNVLGLFVAGNAGSGEESLGQGVATADRCP